MKLERMTTPEDVLSMYWDKKSLPIEPKDIAIKFGIEVRESEELVNLGLSGKLELRENSAPLILVNPNDIKVRQRFTIAHELGHYFCGHDSSPRVDPQFNLNPMVSNLEEKQANSFAAALLMPKYLLEYFIFKKKLFDVNKLASEFGVSGMTMHFRLKNLNFI